MRWIRGDVREGDLVCAPKPFQVMSVDLPRRGPPLGTSENDHGPTWADGPPGPSRFGLNLANLQDTVLQSSGHRLVHALRVTALHEVRRVAVPDEQSLQFRVADSCQHGGIIDLVSVEMEDWQYRAIGDRVQKLVAVPTGGQRTRLGFAVAHHH